MRAASESRRNRVGRAHSYIRWQRAAPERGGAAILLAVVVTD